MEEDLNVIENCSNLIYNHFDEYYGTRYKNNIGFVTVILGSGASASLKTSQLKDELTKGSKGMFNINANVHFGKNRKECTLEELISIYAKINGEKKVYDFLSTKDIYSRTRIIPLTQGYEFLAHLIHHKLINNIISTNFDEELEISLDDEIGSDNYTIVKSLSEFDAFNMEIEGTKEYVFSWDKIEENGYQRLIDYLKQKLGIDWIKEENIIKAPHSVKASRDQKSLLLKLDKNKTEVILTIDGNQVKKFITRMEDCELKIYEETKISLEKPVLFKIHGTISYPRTIRATIENVKQFEDEKLKAIKWVLCNTKIFIIIGFSFLDIDFKHAFSEALKEKAFNDETDKMSIFWIHKTEANRGKYECILENITRKKLIRNRIEGPFFITRNANDFLEILSDKIQEKDKNMRITTIARHKLRNLILENPYLDSLSENKFCLEVIIFALTAKGLFGVSALKDSIRVQRSCNELTMKNKSPEVLLDKLEEKGIIGKLNDYDNIYYLEDSEIGDIARKMVELFELNNLDECKKNSIVDQLNALIEEFDVDIVEPDASIYMMFNDPKPIRDHKEWGIKTNDFVKGSKKLRIIAQTGEWITKIIEDEYFKTFLDNGGRIELITCKKFKNAGMHTVRQENIERILKEMKYNNKSSIVIKYLPWILITEHIKINNKGEGMYMKREAKSSIVAPVFIRNAKDFGLLERKFSHYWRIADTKEFDENESSCPVSCHHYPYARRRPGRRGWLESGRSGWLGRPWQLGGCRMHARRLSCGRLGSL